MKKILLSLLCLISFMAINAEEVTLSYSDVIGLGKSGGGAGFNKTKEPISFSFSNAYGNNAHIKAYGNSSITLSGALITKVVITATSSSYIKTWRANGGNISVSSKTATWEGTSTNLVLNNTAGAQAQITSIVVTYTTSGGGEEPGEGGGEEPGDDPVVPEIPTKGDTYRLVTSDSELEANEKYIIVAAEYDYAMSTTQNSNNRGQNVITKNGNLITLSGEDIDKVQVLTLEEGAIANTWAFFTGEKYLYAASSSGNQLKEITTKNKNASASISIDASGVASIVFKGEYTKNTLRYNSSSSLFACYAPDNSQKDVSLYKYIKTVATPVISINGDDMISITCATEGATIYYTIDGTTPTTSSTKYTGAFKLTVSSLTVNAIAVKDGWKNSTVASEDLVPTAIEEVGVDAGEAVYYNLQGVKVANPENGIFIKKQGGRTSKVVL